MRNVAERNLLHWLRTTGVALPEHGTWSVEHDPRRNSGVAHTVADCPEIRMPSTNGSQSDVETISASHHLCRHCLLGWIGRNQADLPALTRAAFAYLRAVEKAERVDDTNHVTGSRHYPALHAAIVEEVVDDQRRTIATVAGVEVLDAARRAVLGRLDEITSRHPFDKHEAMREAILKASRWKLVEVAARDIHRRGLRQYHNATQELLREFCDRVDRPGQARAIADLLGHENRHLTSASTHTATMLDLWVETIETALSRHEPRYFYCGGYSRTDAVPRDERNWLIGQGLRWRHHHWGLGQLPGIVVEHLAATSIRNDGQARVEALDGEHVELDAERWEIAGALWLEHRNERSSETPYADPANAVAAAAHL